MSKVARYARNEQGRDLVVGDIHGCFSKLQTALDCIGFDPTKDRLFSVGDLVDRGPESAKVLEFLAHHIDGAVQGNHEDMAIRWPNGHMDWGNYAANGGSWMIALDKETQHEVAAALSALPIAIELETAEGLVGIVHAECPFPSWPEFIAKLEDETLSRTRLDMLLSACQWNRNRITVGDTSMVEGVRAVVVGHTPMLKSVTLGNTIYIDTLGWKDGAFTILDAATLQPAELEIA